MYTITTGFLGDGWVSEQHEGILSAMDYADTLFDIGFNYIEVLDEEGKMQYAIEDRSARSPESRETRKRASNEYAKRHGLLKRSSKAKKLERL